MSLELSVIVPAFEEAENLRLLVPRLTAALTEAGIRGEVIIVDDNSSDDTRGAVRPSDGPMPVRLIVRRDERGLSSAVIHGMDHARGEVLLVMDADLSHSPEAVPHLYRALIEDPATDFVVGSRHVAGASVPAESGLLRRLKSLATVALVRPLTVAKDPTGRFFALRRASFTAARDTLQPAGHKIGLELLVKCRCKSIREVPIHFAERRHGRSKRTRREQWNFLKHLKRLYEFKLGALAKPAQFALVGGTGLVVDLSCFALLLALLPLHGARALAIWLAMTWNFWLNRRLTFSFARDRHVVPQYLLFCLSCIAGAGVNWSVSIGLMAVSDWFAAHKLTSALVGVLAGAVVNYLLCICVFGTPRQIGPRRPALESADTVCRSEAVSSS